MLNKEDNDLSLLKRIRNKIPTGILNNYLLTNVLASFFLVQSGVIVQFF